MDQQMDHLQVELQVDYDSGNTIREMSKWVRFISILYMIGLGIMLIVLVFASAALIELIGNYKPELAGLGSVGFAIVFIVMAVYVFLAIQLYRFADMTRKGVDRQDQELFNNGLKSLKLYLMVSGIISILSLVFSVLTTILNLSGARLFDTTY